MQLSTVGRYALRAMVDLAQHQGQGAVQRKDIAARQDISHDYLAQLFRKLKQAGLVESVRGPGGGYMLAQDTAQISAADVLRAVDVSIEPVYCVEAGLADPCPRAEHCPTRGLWARLGDAVAEVLDATTLADLCAEPGQAAGYPME